MKLLHIGLMVDGRNVGLAKELKKQCEWYDEISTGADNLDSKILDLSEGMDAAFFQIQAAGIVSPNTFSELKNRGVKTINWSGDIRRTTENWFLETGADLTLFSNMRDVEFMRVRGFQSDFLQIGIDPDIFHERQRGSMKHEVVFMGNNYGNQFDLGAERLQLVNFLLSKNFAIYGSYRGSIGNLNGNQIEESNVYNHSKIAINHSHFNVDRYTSDRMFRILGSGTFCLSHHYPGIEKDFEVGVHLETYHSLRELEQKINKYRHDAEARNKIAIAGYEHCHENFTYKQMAENIIKYAK